MNSFPQAPDDISCEWLTTILRGSNTLTGACNVEDFSFTYIGGGVGLLGMVLRVFLDYGEDRAGPASLVIKFAHDQPENRQIANNTGLYEREVTFFNAIAPDLTIAMPKCHFAAYDEKSGGNVVVLEDLCDYALGDQIGGISADQAVMVIDSVTPLHAKFWNRGETAFPNMVRIDSDDFIYRSTPGFLGSWESAVERFPEFFPEPLMDALPRYVDGLSNIYKDMGNRTLTVIHGDVRMDNALFGDGKPGLLPVVLIDWQNVMISNPLYDLAWMTATSMTVETRRDCEQDLLSHYVACLKNYGVEGYTLSQCEQDYNIALLFILHFTILIAGAFDISEEKGRTLAETGLQRSIAAALDRNCLALIR